MQATRTEINAPSAAVPGAGFSIVIANYNYASYVGQAITSALEQDYPQSLFEVIVVDDGSTDNSLEIIRAFAGRASLRIISQANLGQMAAFLAGVRVARHEWVCLLDSDDYYMPDKLTRTNVFISTVGQDTHFICHDIDVLDEKNKTAVSWFGRQNIIDASLSVDDASGRYPFANPCGQIYRKEIIGVLAQSLVTEEWKRGADNPLVWGALFLAGRVCYLHESLAVYRIHANNHFLAAGPQGPMPKFDWRARWPRLLEFLGKLDRDACSRYLGRGDRGQLLKRLLQFVRNNDQGSPAPPAQMPLISFITTCKNRLHHLKQTLPAMVAQSHAEVIVVDYGCPQGAAAWVRSSYPSVKIVEVNDDPVFCVARARNLGAAQAAGKILCFIDADIVLNGNISAWIAGHVADEHYYLATDSDAWSTAGTVLFARKHFERLRGYDEAFRGWGGEDKELYERLDESGVSRSSFPAAFLNPIEHGNEERQLDQGAGAADNKVQLLRVYLLYSTIKRDITRLTGQMPDLENRKGIMQYLKDKVRKYAATGQASDASIRIVMNYGLDAYQRVNMDRSLVYSLLQQQHITRKQVAAQSQQARADSQQMRHATIAKVARRTKSRSVMFHIGRSGSSVLADMLAQHPDMRWDGEIYERQLQALEDASGALEVGGSEPRVDPLQVLNRHLAGLPDVHYGFEAKFFHLQACGVDLETYVDGLRRLGIDKFIVLQRKNSLRKIISSLVARQTGVWHVPAAKPAPVVKVFVNTNLLEVDRQRKPLLEFLDSYKFDFERLAAILNGSSVLRLSYEDDIQAAPMLAYGKVMDYLGLPSGSPTIRLARTNPYPLDQLIENYSEVRAVLSATEYGWMLND